MRIAKRIGLSVAIAVSLAAMPAVAAIDCGEILQHGLWGYQTYVSGSQQADYARDWYCNKYSKSQSNSAGGGFSFAGVGLSGDVANSSAVASQACADKITDTKTAEAVQATWKRASESIVGAWRQCTSDKAGFLGLTFFAQPTASGKTVKVTISFALPASKPVEADIKLVAKELKCEALPASISNNQRLNITCDRDPTKESILTLNSQSWLVNGKEGSGFVVIPPVQERAPAIPMPMDARVAQVKRISKLKVTTQTANSKNAETDALVFASLGGVEIRMFSDGKNDHKKGATESFVQRVAGRLTLQDLERYRIRVWHDNTDRGKPNTTPDWNCEWLLVEYELEGTPGFQKYKNLPVGWLKGRNDKPQIVERVVQDGI